MTRNKFVIAVGWRLLVMALCAAAVSLTGWHVAYEGLFENAFASGDTVMIGCMSVSGFVSWLYLAAGVFIQMQDEVKLICRHRVEAIEREGARRRLALLMQSDITPRNAKTIITRIHRVK